MSGADRPRRLRRVSEVVVSTVCSTGVRRTIKHRCPSALVSRLDHSDEAAQALLDGPIGAYLVAGISVGLVFIAWLVFYFFVFMPRGAIG